MSWKYDPEWEIDYSDEPKKSFSDKKKKTKKKIAEPEIVPEVKEKQLVRKATLIKLENQRQIICNPNIANLMIEFAKTFKAQIYNIEFETPQEIDLMSLDQTVAFICEGNDSKNIPPHKIITILVNIKEEDYIKDMKNAVAICLTENKIAKVDFLKEKFPKIDPKTIKNYILELGEKIKKTGVLKIDFNENYIKVS